MEFTGTYMHLLSYCIKEHIAQKCLMSMGWL